MELLTKADLELLAEPEQAEPQVSLFIPTHEFGAGTQTDPIRWKNLITRVERVLAERGTRAPEIAGLLAPALDLQDNDRAWRYYMSDGLAMFLRPGWHRTFRVPVGVPELATIGDRFVLGPLLGIITGDGHFLMLTLSQRRVRLLEGSMQKVAELELADVPTKLLDVIEPPEPRLDTMAFPLSSGPRRSGAAVFYGHGTADDDFKHTQLRGFLRQVSDGLSDYLTGQSLPMVLAGLDEMISLYLDVNAYPHVLEDAVRRNPDQLSAAELHAAAWPLVERILDRERDAAVARFAELHGTGLASNNAAKIEEAARNGRVDTLFLATEPWCWEQLPGDGAVVQLGADDAFAHCELLDRAAMHVLSSGGRVHAIHAEAVPSGDDVAAIFRY